MNDKLEGVVLLTGASGFIGGRLRDALLDAGADVVAVRRKGSPEAKRGRSVVVEYSDKEGLADVLAKEKPRFVYHVAGATKGVTYDDFQRANVMPTQTLLDALEAAHPGVERFVHISSLAAYGPSTKDAPLREDSPRKPIEFYGRSKLEAEQVVERSRVKWTIVRPSGVYGPGDGDYLELFKSAKKGLNVFFGNRDRWFSAIYVDDLVRACRLAAESEASVGKGYFVSDGRPITWGEFQSHVVEASGRRARTVDLPGFIVDVAAWGGELLTRIDDKPRLFNRQKALMGAQEAWTCTVDALRKDTGFEPMVEVPEGVRKTFDWYRAERWL